MKKNKHDHKGTKALKLTIFFTLMLAPFMAVLFKCVYVTFNKNAKDSYTSQYIESRVDLTNPNQLVENQEYIFNYKEYETTSYSYLPYVEYNSISIDWSSYTTQDVSNVIAFRMRTNDNLLQLKNSDNTNINLFNVWGISLKTFTINFKSLEFSSTTPFYNISVVGLLYKQDTLDNAFYYAIEEAMDSPYFAWAQTSALYTATSGLTNGIGINTQAIPTLLVYWLILTTIYIIFDIVIESFTYLTHMITSRFE